MTLQGLVEHGRFGKGTDGTNAPFFDGSQVCAQVDPELFFPENALEALHNIKLVRPICTACEFRNPCLAYALEHKEEGIWGGMTERERNQLRRRKT